MTKINWTFKVEKWLKDIYDYISEDNPKAALRTVESIYEKVQILLKFPRGLSSPFTDTILCHHVNSS